MKLSKMSKINLLVTCLLCSANSVDVSKVTNATLQVSKFNARLITFDLGATMGGNPALFNDPTTTSFVRVILS